jgi:DNA-directed RNA polymerase subunit RPC12/RpoP
MPTEDATPRRNTNTEPYRCPRCSGKSLTRMHRTRFDRMISLLVPVKRYECEACSWQGRVRVTAQKEADDAM